ncbi:hypothetical protein [Belnapia sp. F-4-1]|uniref:hypothetical protein n=1 Tax=Belnapia sp. F-4-1 TaxID=1545443 RepID=UPI0005B8848C|nr:hypothetical protein [Belnapia sp. F-4-1]
MRTITGLFDSRAEAERAVETLVQQFDYPRDRIQVQAAGADNATAGTQDRRSESHHGFDRGQGGGEGILVSLLIEDDQVEKATRALETNGGKIAEQAPGDQRPGAQSPDI